MLEMETDTGKLCSVPRSHHTSCGQAPVSFREDQRIHVGNVNIVVPFVAAMSPSSSPFEMQNQNVFNFGDRLGRYLRATQA